MKKETFKTELKQHLKHTQNQDKILGLPKIHNKKGDDF